MQRIIHNDILTFGKRLFHLRVTRHTVVNTLIDHRWPRPRIFGAHAVIYDVFQTRREECFFFPVMNRFWNFFLFLRGATFMNTTLEYFACDTRRIKVSERGSDPGRISQGREDEKNLHPKRGGILFLFQSLAVWLINNSQHASFTPSNIQNDSIFGT